MRFRELDRECSSACVEYICRLADAFTAKYPTDYVAEALGLRATFVSEETVSPSAFYMRQHGKHAAVWI